MVLDKWKQINTKPKILLCSYFNGCKAKAHNPKMIFSRYQSCMQDSNSVKYINNDLSCLVASCPIRIIIFLMRLILW